MAEYLPTYKPGQALNLKASAAIAAGQIVAVTGVGTVGPAGATSSTWIGVAATDAATNDTIVVFCDGVGEVVASGTVTQGDAVATGAAGTVATSATPTAAQFVGLAISTATTGNKVRIKFSR